MLPFPALFTQSKNTKPVTEMKTNRPMYLLALVSLLFHCFETGGNAKIVFHQVGGCLWEELTLKRQSGVSLGTSHMSLVGRRESKLKTRPILSVFHRHSDLFFFFLNPVSSKALYYRLNDLHGTLEIIVLKASCLEKLLRGTSCHFWLSQDTFNPLNPIVRLAMAFHQPPKMSNVFWVKYLKNHFLTTGMYIIVLII